ncbi:ABC transporter ATP-binding protein [Pseudoduganella albidiflava]|uniref:ABC transporter ATP-binding protein n=1 Tax=Pseudoduganella albidiflava TaxID=321983 RepID=A0A411X3Q0_9BURK|nr:ABC transporter ATP-binding protein [Pseudoduganella albidiflava]QBI03656.1 ABC transporter ATP-binding protein [Pseudoduganella albidiflava]GGY51740.1 ABC transporter ATP-binding protein [Pseudoduganella albidiflava]
MREVLLEVRDLAKSYGKRRAVDGVSFHVRRGQTVGLLGPNGAGKSTTVGIIAGILDADAGEVLLDGQPAGTRHHDTRRRIGLVPQDLALYDDLPAVENLKLFGALYGLKNAALAARCAAVLELVGLADRARDRPATFSGGMKRRLNIAAALLHEPALLILDEPTVGVDPQSRNAIFDTLAALQRAGTALVYTSHYMEEVERLADHIVIIDHGRVLADESPAALYARLPARAALHVDLAEALSGELAGELARLPGVAGLLGEGPAWDVRLQDSTQAIAVLDWLRDRGQVPVHFATARARLEEVFLDLTGRSLRD